MSKRVLASVPKVLFFYTFSYSISFIFRFSGFYLKDLWYYIHLLFLLYLTLSDISFDFDSLMIFLKYAVIFLTTGILFVYLVYLYGHATLQIFIKNILYFLFILQKILCDSFNSYFVVYLSLTSHYKFL